MKNTKEKRGISLIVMVISIIVMIILATAVILALSSNGIIGKANKAKQDSDSASMKEYINVLKAEWEVMSEKNKVDQTMSKYVNQKLEEKGYENVYLTENGTVYTNLQANSKEILEAGIEIGDVVTGYILDASDSKKSYKTSGKENTAPNKVEVDSTTDTKQTIIRIEYETWRYIGIGENGEVLIAPDMVSSVTDSQKIKLSGKGGYLNGPQELNNMCAAMYSTSKGTARSMNIDDITRILDYTGNKGSYYDENGDLVNTAFPKKISELGILSNTKTPDGSEIENYYSDWYIIDKTNSYILKSMSDELKEVLTNFVFTKYSYLLASSCIRCDLKYSAADFLLRCVSPIRMSSTFLFDTLDSSNLIFLPARPVVSLGSNIQLTKVSDGNWSI